MHAAFISLPPLSELYAEHRPRALAIARRIVGDVDDAEDVVQDVFLSVWRDPGAFDAGRGSFSSWLMAMVHHKAVDAVRRERVQRLRPVREQVAPARLARGPDRAGP